MRHRILTCKNHPNLRWSCKDCAWTVTDNGGYFNGSRTLGYRGVPSGKGMFSDNSGLDCSPYLGGAFYQECECKTSDLILAPEDDLVK